MPGTHRPSLHLWWWCSCHMESHCASPPASSGNLPHTGGSQTWLLIKMTGGVLTICRCLGPNYHEKLIPVSLVCYPHDWDFQFSPDSSKVRLELRATIILYALTVSLTFAWRPSFVAPPLSFLNSRKVLILKDLVPAQCLVWSKEVRFSHNFMWLLTLVWNPPQPSSLYIQSWYWGLIFSRLSQSIPCYDHFPFLLSGFFFGQKQGG